MNATDRLVPPVTRRTVLTSGGLALLGLCSTTRSARAGSSAPRRIKIGQIGVGHGHATKLSVYRNSDEYEVVGIVEPDAELRARAENQPPFQGLTWMTREQLLNLPGLEAVLVETRVRDLLDQAEACIAAGKHVHIDKPAGESLEQFRRILAAAAQKNLLVQMGYMYRYNPAVVLLRRFLEQGWLGELFEVHAVMSKVVGQAERKQLAEYEGGMMFELGCHLLDLVVALLGKPNDVATFHRRSSPRDDDLLDNTLAVLGYPRATATIRSSALEIDGGQRRHLVVCGTEGTFHIQPLDDPVAQITLSRPREDVQRQTHFRRGTQEVRFPKYVRYVDDAADMAQIIRGEKPCDFSAEHDLAVQETLLRACGLERPA
jgi:predicted dehydrogenase